MFRKQTINTLKSTNFDIVIIGGGASGLGVALDAASRGLNVALVESNDFASGPSSFSTKLAHGGVRYLEKAVFELSYGQYKLVHEALQERKHFLENAPHLSSILPLILPTKNIFEKIYYRIGIWFYDLIAKGSGFPTAQALNYQETKDKFPLNSNKFKGSILYYDGQFNDGFLATSLARTAQKEGATLLNHCKCVNFQFNANKSVETVNVVDQITGEKFNIKTQSVINCTGVQSDFIRNLTNSSLKPRLRPSKGIHIVVDRSYLKGDTALILPETSDGRVLFAIPWYHSVIIGTTDTEFKEKDENFADKCDIQYVLDQINPWLEKTLTKNDIKSVFSGLRPLVKSNKAKTEALIRNHEVEVFANERVINLLGGKWTTFRVMAEETIDQWIKMMKWSPLKCKTLNLKLIGGENNNEIIPKEFQNQLKFWGSEASIIIEKSKTNNFQRMHPDYPILISEIEYLIENGFCCKIQDIMNRGTRIELIDWRATWDSIELIANILQNKLSWTNEYKINEINNYKNYLNKIKDICGLEFL